MKKTRNIFKFRWVLVGVLGVVLAIFCEGSVRGFTQCTKASGNRETRIEKNLSSFSEISVSNDIDVILKKGSSREAAITAEKGIMDNIKIETSGNTLSIRVDPCVLNAKNITVVLTYTSRDSFSNITLSSSAKLDGGANTVNTSYLEVDSSAIIENIKIESSKLNVEVSSSGNANISVSVTTLDAKADSSGEMILEGKADKGSFTEKSSGKIFRSGLQVTEVLGLSEEILSEEEEAVVSCPSSGAGSRPPNPKRGATAGEIEAWGDALAKWEDVRDACLDVKVDAMVEEARKKEKAIPKSKDVDGCKEKRCVPKEGTTSATEKKETLPTMPKEDKTPAKTTSTTKGGVTSDPTKKTKDKKEIPKPTELAKPPPPSKKEKVPPPDTKAKSLDVKKNTLTFPQKKKGEKSRTQGIKGMPISFDMTPSGKTKSSPFSLTVSDVTTGGASFDMKGIPAAELKKLKGVKKGSTAKIDLDGDGTPDIELTLHNTGLKGGGGGGPSPGKPAETTPAEEPELELCTSLNYPGIDGGCRKGKSCKEKETKMPETECAKKLNSDAVCCTLLDETGALENKCGIGEKGLCRNNCKNSESEDSAGECAGGLDCCVPRVGETEKCGEHNLGTCVKDCDGDALSEGTQCTGELICCAKEAEKLGKSCGAGGLGKCKAGGVNACGDGFSWLIKGGASCKEGICCIADAEDTKPCGDLKPDGLETKGLCINTFNEGCWTLGRKEVSGGANCKNEDSRCCTREDDVLKCGKENAGTCKQECGGKETWLIMGGESCGSGLKCCVEQAGLNKPCGGNKEGTCLIMDTPPMCPDVDGKPTTAVHGGADCGEYLKCCAPKGDYEGAPCGDVHDMTGKRGQCMKTTALFSCPGDQMSIISGLDCASGFKCCTGRDAAGKDIVINCGEDELGTCKSAAVGVCPDDWDDYKDGVNCDMGMKCCISKRRRNDPCGRLDPATGKEAGICKRTEWTKCPGSSTAVEEGADCEGLLFRCCTP